MFSLHCLFWFIICYRILLQWCFRVIRKTNQWKVLNNTGFLQVEQRNMQGAKQRRERQEKERMGGREDMNFHITSNAPYNLLTVLAREKESNTKSRVEKDEREKREGSEKERKAGEMNGRGKKWNKRERKRKRRIIKRKDVKTRELISEPFMCCKGSTKIKQNIMRNIKKEGVMFSLCVCCCKQAQKQISESRNVLDENIEREWDKGRGSHQSMNCNESLSNVQALQWERERERERERESILFRDLSSHSLDARVRDMSVTKNLLSFSLSLSLVIEALLFHCLSLSFALLLFCSYYGSF